MKIRFYSYTDIINILTLPINLPNILNRILGVSLFMVIRQYTFIQSVLFGAGSGIGWTLAILAMAGIRQRLMEQRIPAGLRGPGIALIISGIMAMAFIGFSGIVQIQ